MRAVVICGKGRCSEGMGLGCPPHQLCELVQRMTQKVPEEAKTWGNLATLLAFVFTLQPEVLCRQTDKE